MKSIDKAILRMFSIPHHLLVYVNFFWNCSRRELVKGTGFSSTTNLQRANYWLRNRPRIECKLWTFTTVQVLMKASQLQKHADEHHQSQPISMTLWTAHEANNDQPRFWLARYFLLSDVLSSPVWSCLLDSTSLSRNMSLAYHSYLHVFFVYKCAEIQK